MGQLPCWHVDENGVQQTPSHEGQEDTLTEPNVFEVNTHAFVVKVWLEETGFEGETVLWRGHITHAFSGERRYFQDLRTVLDFISSYLIVN